jgi:DNA-binding CsgD family transcriptional regulator
MMKYHPLGMLRRYLAGGLAILVGWTVVAVVLLQRERFGDTGPLSLHQPPLRSALPGGPSPERVLAACFPDRSARDQYHLVGGLVDGRPLYTCYQLAADGTVRMAKVVDENGRRVMDVGVVKRGGAWPWVGALNSDDDILLAVFATAVLLLLTGVIYDRERAGPPPGEAPRWARGPLLWSLLAVPLAGWLVLLAMPGVGAARRWWLFRRVVLVALGLAAAFPAVLLEWRVDPPGVAGALLPLVAFAYGVGAGRQWLAAAGTTGRPDGAAAAAGAAGTPDELDKLTGRELEVLRHLAMGLSNAEIARTLFVSEATVKSHVARVLTKLGFGNRVQAARFAYQHGLLDPTAGQGRPPGSP